MVKFLMSFLISFKSFPDNGTQFYSDSTDTKYSTRERPPVVRFRTHPERKNICNITYILPGSKEMIERKISIGCWSPMLKVYGKKEDYYFRTEVKNGKTWAAFSLSQIVDDLQPIQFIRTMFTKSIEFYFNEEQRYLQRYRGEQWTSFLCPNISNENIFGPIYYAKERSTSPSKQRNNTAIQDGKKKGTSYSSKHKQEILKNKLSEPEICSKVAVTHLYKIIKSMDRIKNECMSPRSPTSCYLALPIMKLYHDKPVWVLRNERPMSKNIQDIFVFVTVYSLLDEETRETLIPISINIQSLQYLPVKELQAEGINRLFVEYQLEPVIPTTRTKLNQLRKDCRNSFKDIRVFLNEKINPLTIISSFQSKKLFVRVIGVRDSLPDTNYGKDRFLFYGEDMYDERFSSCVKMPVTTEFQKVRTPIKTKPRTRRRSSVGKVPKFKFRRRFDDQQLQFLNKDLLVLIGTARIDLSPLVFGNSSITVYKELSSLPVLIESRKTVDLEHLCITDVHKDMCIYEKGAVENRILYENNAMIKLTAKCGFLLTPNCVHTDPSIKKAFSRVITILSDKEFSAEILQTIFEFNRESLDMREFDLPLVPFQKIYKLDRPSHFNSILTFNKEPSCLDSGTSSKNQIESINLESYFTGFCIDCVNQILMFIEGPTISTIPTLLTELVKFNINQGRILYSSDLLYETRIYDDLKIYGGIYCITMKSMVDDYLKKGSSLCYGVSVPEPAWKALNMISKLLRCKTVLEVVQDGNLPSPEQLISFDIEFGLPNCIVK